MSIEDDQNASRASEAEEARKKGADAEYDVQDEKALNEDDPITQSPQKKTEED